MATGLLACALATPAAAAELEQPSSSARPPAGYELSADEVLAVARAVDVVRAERRARGGLDPTVYTNGPGRWQVSFFAGGDEVAQVHVDDATRAVEEAWTGPQVAWKMARGYEGQFGRKLNAPYVWLPLCLVFLLPFLDPRRPFRILHLDLLVLLAFGASHVFFNRGEIFTSVPLVYPVLLYLLVRTLWIGFRPRARRGPLIPVLPVTIVALALLFLVGFRVALNVLDSSVIDVGYAGVIGADVIADGDGLYDETFPEDNDSGDTYGPVTYLAYLPFEQAFPWSGGWDDLPAAHGAAIAFDLGTIAALFLVGRRLRAGREGTTLGVALAFAWASYPYTTFALASNSNDALVALLVTLAFLGLTSAPARGLLLALAGAAKFAPLALAPLFLRGATLAAARPVSGGGESAGGSGPGGSRVARARARARLDRAGPLVFAAVFCATVAALVVAFLPDVGLRELYDRTVGYQAGRDSPFSVWGQAEGLGWLQTAVKAAAVTLAVAVAVVPRRRGPIQVAALGAAVLIGVQLAVSHWFYLYIVWFAPLLFVALLALQRQRPGGSSAPAGESERGTTAAASG